MSNQAVVSNEGMFSGFLLSILFLPLIYLGVILIDKKRNKEKFSFMNYFPYEASHRENRYIQTPIYIFEFLAICTSVMPGLYIFFAIKDIVGINILIYMIAQIVISSIAASCFFMLTLYSVSKPKLHLTLFFTMLVSLILKSAMAAKILFDLKEFSDSNTSYALAFILLIITILAFLVLGNPALNHWDKMDNVTHDDGTISYERPKKFVLAYSEWIIIGLCWITDILFIIGAYMGVIGK